MCPGLALCIDGKTPLLSIVAPWLSISCDVHHVVLLMAMVPWTLHNIIPFMYHYPLHSICSI